MRPYNPKTFAATFYGRMIKAGFGPTQIVRTTAEIIAHLNDQLRRVSPPVRPEAGTQVTANAAHGGSKVSDTVNKSVSVVTNGSSAL